MRLLVLLLVPALLWAEDPPSKDQNAETKKKVEKERPGDLEVGEPGTLIEDASVARAEVARFSKALRNTRKNDQERKIELLKRLGKWDHPEILKAAAKLIKDRSHPVSVQAVVVCAKQTNHKAKAGATLFRALKREKRTHVVCALLIGLGALGYDKKAVIATAESYFKRDTKETHKAATRYFGYIKYKPAFRLLAEKLDEPRPGNVNSPSNPPASYWRARWFEWQANVEYTRWAINQLVPGESFDQKAEAKEWAETEGKKHGISW